MNVCNKLECFLGRHFQSSLMFAGKLSSAPLYGKVLTTFSVPARNKHSSLLQKFAKYGRKKFYNTGPSLKTRRVDKLMYRITVRRSVRL